MCYKNHVWKHHQAVTVITTCETKIPEKGGRFRVELSGGCGFFLFGHLVILRVGWRTGICLDTGLLLLRRGESSRAFSRCVGWTEKLRLQGPQINGHFFSEENRWILTLTGGERTRPKAYIKQSETSHGFTVFRKPGKGTKTRHEPQP